MPVQNTIEFDITVDGNRAIKIGEPYSFQIKIANISINKVRIVKIKSIQIGLGLDLTHPVVVDSSVPCQKAISVNLPKVRSSWYPVIIINGMDEYGYPQQVPFLSVRPVISTDYFPIYDARLGRSNWTLDEGKVLVVKNLLNQYGFDCTTIGKELTANVPRGKKFMDYEKDWASGGNCFIAVLTPRDITNNGRLALPPPWIVAESGLSYSSDRPHLVFVEDGVNPVALYSQMDKNHVIFFKSQDNRLHFENSAKAKLLAFRDECGRYDSDKKLQGLGQLVFIGFAFYGGYKILEDLFKK